MFTKYFSSWQLLLTIENSAQSKRTNKKNQHAIVSSLVKHKAAWVKYRKLPHFPTLQNCYRIPSHFYPNSQKFSWSKPNKQNYLKAEQEN